MNKSYRRIVFVFVIVFAALALLTTAVSHANHSWGGYHWARTANPFTLKVGNNLTSNWQTQFDTSITIRK